MYVSHENVNTDNDYAIGERQNGSYIIRVIEIYRVYRLVFYYLPYDYEGQNDHETIKSIYYSLIYNNCVYYGGKLVLKYRLI